MRDGPEQEARDEVFLNHLNGKPYDGPFPSRWTCPDVQPWLYGYDAFEEVASAVKEHPFSGEAIIEESTLTGVRPKVNHLKKNSIDRLASWVKTRVQALET
jgi:hypothetical protein